MMKPLFLFVAFASLAFCATAQSVLQGNSSWSGNNVFGGGAASSGGGGGGGGSCPANGSPSVENTDRNNNTPVSASAGAVLVGQRGWSDGSSRTICKVKVEMYGVTGDVSGKDFYCLIYSMSGNNLSSVVGTSDVMLGNNSWSTTKVFFTFSTMPTLTASTSYAIVFCMVTHGSSATSFNVDAGNHVNIVTAGTDVLAGGWDTWTSGGAEQSGVTTADVCMALYYFQ